MIRALLLLAALAAAPARAEESAAGPAAEPAKASTEPKLPEVNLTYGVSWNGIGLGKATIVLKPEGGPDCYRYETITDPSGLVRMFVGKPRETSDFCVAGGRVVPKRFEFVNPKEKDRSFTLEFNMAAGKVATSRGETFEIPANSQDRFGMQQAVRLWVLDHKNAKETGESVEFTLVEDRRTKVLRFAVTGAETVEVPAGKFETLLVQRVDDPNKSTKFWLAPEKGYMPIKVEQLKGGKVDLRMELR